MTFVLTDVEGSTRLFRRIGDRYPPLLERHRELLREVWQAHGGHELTAGGDGFFVVFAEPADAVAACAHAQRRLSTEPWPADAVIRVRMGVHSGLAAPRDDGYVAFAAHQAARVADAANGGQVVLSAAVARRVGDMTDTELVSLGRFRVRDFDEPVELFRLDIVGVEPVETAVRALPAERHNLLRPLTELVGRDAELRELAELARSHRLVSVVGVGGLGKTRLVVEYGLAHAADWGHGIWFADFSRIDDPSGIATVLAQAVGVSPGHDREVWDVIVDHLRDRETVVLLDNCEHLGDDVALRAVELLGACPGVRIIATSREPLGPRGERVWRPAPLGVETGVELFCRLAGLADPGPAALEAITALCTRVDGLPLAIELAAARADLIDPAEIVAGLDAGRGLGTSRDPTLDRRQRSLEDLIAWSYALLSLEEQQLFRRLGVFETGFDLDAAAAVMGAHREPALVADLMRSLLDKSLVTADLTTGTDRHRLHMTVRSYARHVLDSEGELDDSASQLAEHYLAAIGPQVDAISAGPSVYRRRAIDVDNLRHLIPIVSDLDRSTALALAVVVVDTTMLSSRRQALNVGLSLLDRLPGNAPERVALLDSTSGAASGSGNLALARELTEQASALRDSVGEPRWLDGAIDEARAVHALFESDPTTALSIARAGLATVTTPHGEARLQGTVGCASVELGDLDAAEAAFEIELRHYSEPTAWRATALCNLTDVALRRGDIRRAGSLHRSAFDISIEVGHVPSVLFSIGAGARLAASTGDWTMAYRLANCLLAQQAPIGLELFPTDRAIIDSLLTDAALHLDRGTLEQHRMLGEATTIEDAITLTRSVVDAITIEGTGTAAATAAP